ncbi:unnamed protein product [Pleuronectes platessa]|uniref:Uncharacterized protein n=1 Tax=Pleuronectes platessa TaxID=8262 RepID=A0A9N7YBJ0_PLEPL|nr:unnamed protein product [Pleuronectes platessa]
MIFISIETSCDSAETLYERASHLGPTNEWMMKQEYCQGRGGGGEEEEEERVGGAAEEVKIQSRPNDELQRKQQTSQSCKSASEIFRAVAALTSEVWTTAGCTARSARTKHSVLSSAATVKPRSKVPGKIMADSRRVETRDSLLNRVQLLQTWSQKNNNLCTEEEEDGRRWKKMEARDHEARCQPSLVSPCRSGAVLQIRTRHMDEGDMQQMTRCMIGGTVRRAKVLQEEGREQRAVGDGEEK